MRAVIDGIEVYGTPAEILEFKRLTEASSKTHSAPTWGNGAWSIKTSFVTGDGRILKPGCFVK